MTSKQQTRLVLVVALLTGVSLAAFFVFKALDQNMMYFYQPSEVAAGNAPVGERFRVGGLVVPGSVSRSKESLAVSFDVTDNVGTTTIRFNGILPDLFREGQGIIAHGKLDGAVFSADKVLAKHDENYMPPEVADALKAQNNGIMPFGDAQRASPSGSYGAKP